jgi:xylose dehydrogenase (NAD/NADP)
MMERLRWGILGTGNIARQFAVGVNASLRGALAAAGSRQEDKARAFAATHHVPAAYGSYESVIADRNVDAIYNSLPNSLHYEWTIAALRAGKHVLSEKPFAMSAAQSEAMFDAADKAGRVLMEAFMYRSHPLTHAVLNTVRGGAIGAVRMIRASFCYRTTNIAGNIRFNPELGGGGLMDVGCYCINFARLFAGAEPAAVHVGGHKHERGVDEIAAGTLVFPNGIVAGFTCGMSVQADNTAYICGSEGFVEVPVPWKPPATKATFSVVRATPPRMDAAADTSTFPARPHVPRQAHSVDAGMDLYGLEADDFAAAVLDNAPPRVSREDTLGNMRVLDEARRQLGVVFDA